MAQQMEHAEEQLKAMAACVGLHLRYKRHLDLLKEPLVPSLALASPRSAMSAWSRRHVASLNARRGQELWQQEMGFRTQDTLQDMARLHSQTVKTRTPLGHVHHESVDSASMSGMGLDRVQVHMAAVARVESSSKLRHLADRFLSTPQEQSCVVLSSNNEEWADSIAGTLLALRHCLHGSLDAQPNIRAAAEEHLHRAAQQEKFAPLLVQTVLSINEVPESFRQLAAVVLKKYVKEHWDQGAKNFQAPLCSEPDKATVRQMLPGCLGDPSSKVRTAVAMAISGIAKHDFPHQWPGILEWMVTTVRDQQDRNLVLGVLRCLSMIAEDIDEQQLPQVLPVLLPSLLVILANPQYEPSVKRQVLSILHAVLAQLSLMQGTFARQVRDLMAPLLEPWIPAMAAVLAAPLTQDAACWALKMECLQIMVALISYFGKLLGGHMPSLLAPCWAMFTGSGRALHQAVLVSSADDSGESGGAGDDDDDGVGLEAMLSQMFEVLLTLVGNPRFSKLLKPAMHELVYTTISYMQMTRDQEESWTDNPNMYVADEEDATYTARVSGELLLDELFKSSGFPAVTATLDAVDKTLQDAEAARKLHAAGSTAAVPQGSALVHPADWWKLREAAVLAAGCIAEPLRDLWDEFGRGKSAKPAGVAVQVKGRLQSLLDSLLNLDLAGAHSNPFLAGRALWAAAKLARFMSPGQVDQYLAAACTGIRSNLPAPVRIGACRALVQLLPRVKAGPGESGPAALQTKLAPLLPALYEGLVRLLAESSEEMQHLVLETLEVVVKNDTGCVVQQYLPQVAGPVLRVWEETVADPLIGEDAQLVLAALAAHPACLLPLAQELLPALVKVISTPKGQKPMLVEGSLALLRSLVRSPAAARGQGGLTDGASGQAGDQVTAQHMAVVQQVYLTVIGPLLSLIATSDDSGEQAEAQQLFCQLIRTGRSQLLAWSGGDPAHTVAQMLACAYHLLRGGVGEMESALAGHIITDTLNAWPEELVRPHVHQILELVAQRLVTVNVSTLVSGLLLVLSKLAHMDCKALIEALAAMQVKLPNGQVACALDAVLPIWAERTGDVHGRYYRLLVITALGNLLECGHPRLQQVQMRGVRLDVSRGVQTRSQLAAAGGEQWSVVTAPLKLVASLAQVLVDSQEADQQIDPLDELYGGYDDEDDDDEGEEGEESDGGEQGHDGMGLSVQGTGTFTPAQTSLLRTLSQPGASGAWSSSMVEGDGVGGGLLDGGPLSPSSALHDDDTAAAAEDAAPPGDPLTRVDLNKWLQEVFQRMALHESGQAMLKAASEGAMSKKQAEAVQKLLHGSRLRV